ncbi:MAG: hypothetical protein U1E70_05030 [Acetobacteraceae bacterium]|nr:hypothetical protein [Pseudomonadota bacterium]
MPSRVAKARRYFTIVLRDRLGSSASTVAALITGVSLVIATASFVQGALINAALQFVGAFLAAAAADIGVAIAVNAASI